MENVNINLNRHENLQLFRCNKGVALGYPFTTFTDHNRQRLLYVGMELGTEQEGEGIIRSATGTRQSLPHRADTRDGNVHLEKADFGNSAQQINTRRTNKMSGGERGKNPLYAVT
jgi:hypothetical protein